MYFYFIKESSLHCPITRFIFLVLKCNNEIATWQKIWELFDRRIWCTQEVPLWARQPLSRALSQQVQTIGRVARDFLILIIDNSIIYDKNRKIS